MTGRRITDSDISRICNDLVQEGLTPTADRVRARHGAGSKGTVIRGIKHWEQLQAPTSEEARVAASLQQQLRKCEQKLDELISDNEQLAADFDESNAEYLRLMLGNAKLIGQLETLTQELHKSQTDLMKALEKR